MVIPDFLRPENTRELTEEQKRLKELTQKYRKTFGRDFATEPFIYTDKEWSEMIEYCLKEYVLMETLTGEELT